MAISSADISWSAFSDSIERLEQAVINIKTGTITSIRFRRSAQRAAQVFFRQCAVDLLRLGIDDDLFDELNFATQSIMTLSSNSSSKSAYIKAFRKLRRVINQVTLDREFKYWDQSAMSYQPNPLSATEVLIHDTLIKLLPSAARSFKQAISDLSDNERLSYRGVANELREALRETLDHLAPDQDVQARPGFQLEKNQTTPTVKQKVRYILRARELAENAIRAPEEAVAIIEDRIASFARATYVRSSISAHVAAEREEVLQVKNYVLLVLAEVLALRL
jgi:hypothetical protein